MISTDNRKKSFKLLNFKIMYLPTVRIRSFLFVPTFKIFFYVLKPLTINIYKNKMISNLTIAFKYRRKKLYQHKIIRNIG